MRVVFDLEAQREVGAAKRYYNQQREGLGEEFLDSVRDGLRRVRDQPESCPIEHLDIRRLVLRRFPYKLLYTVQADHVFVVAVAHQHRNPGYWTDRLSAPN